MRHGRGSRGRPVCSTQCQSIPTRQSAHSKPVSCPADIRQSTMLSSRRDARWFDSHISISRFCERWGNAPVTRYSVMIPNPLPHSASNFDPCPVSHSDSVQRTSPYSTGQENHEHKGHVNRSERFCGTNIVTPFWPSAIGSSHPGLDCRAAITNTAIARYYVGLLIDSVASYLVVHPSFS